MFRNSYSKQKQQYDPKLEPMRPEDIDRVIDIIEQTDEDDAEEAAELLKPGALEGMFVLVEDNEVLGVTGAVVSEGGDDVVWLSWTYLDTRYHGEGLGRFMLEGLLEKLDNHGIRKIFIASSDYEEDGEAVYGAAHDLYTKLGAKQELVIPDYYDDGESILVFGLTNSNYPAQPEEPAPPDLSLNFTGCEESDDADGIWCIEWEVREGGEMNYGRQETSNKLSDYEKKALSMDARALVLAIPDDLSETVKQELELAGFVKAGCLTDFYAASIGQEWWINRLN